MLAVNAQNIRNIQPNQEMLCVSYKGAVAVGKHGHLQDSCPISPGSLGVSIFFGLSVSLYRLPFCWCV